MTHLTNRLMLTAAVALIATGTAMAQDALRGNIPFKFRAGGEYLPAGDYKITTLTAHSGSVYLVRNVDTSKAVAVMVRYSIQRSDATPKLVFRCHENECTLAEMWNGSGAGWALTNPPTKADVEREASTRVIPLKAGD